MPFTREDVQRIMRENRQNREEVLALMHEPPNNPIAALFSRRAQSVPIKGDAIAFPLEIDTVTPVSFIETIKLHLAFAASLRPSDAAEYDQFISRS